MWKYGVADRVAGVLVHHSHTHKTHLLKKKFLSTHTHLATFSHKCPGGDVDGDESVGGPYYQFSSVNFKMS